MLPSIVAAIVAASPPGGPSGGPPRGGPPGGGAYDIVMFAHILAAIGLFVAIGIEAMAVLRMRRARTIMQVREWGLAARAMYYLHLVTSPLIVATGIAMMVMRTGFTTAWVDVSLVTMLCLSASGMWVSRKRLNVIDVSAQQLPDGVIPATLARQIGDRVLFTTVQTQVVVGLGILYLMVLKPEGWGDSAIAIVVAAILGAVSAQVTRRLVFVAAARTLSHA